MNHGADSIDGLNFVGFNKTGGRLFRVKKPTKAQLGLGNVDNTSDMDKPVSTAQQAALDGKQDTLGFIPVADDDPRLSDARTPTAHNHDAAYAAINHNHDLAYAPISHNHDATYAPIVHTHDYAATDHNHDGVYQPAGNYAAASHNHDGVYQPAATGTPNGTKYLRDDNTWQPVAGGSGISLAVARQLTRR